MDPYERLAAINEEITRLREPHRVQKKKQTRRAKPIKQSLMGKIKGFFKRKPKEETPVQMFSRLAAGIQNRTPEEVAAKLDVETRQRDKKIFGESTEAERIDQAGAKGKKALEDAGIKFKFRQGIGSMDREDNHYIVSPENVKAAKKALKGVSNAKVREDRPFKKVGPVKFAQGKKDSK